MRRHYSDEFAVVKNFCYDGFGVVDLRQDLCFFVLVLVLMSVD